MANGIPPVKTGEMARPPRCSEPTEDVPNWFFLGSAWRERGGPLAGDGPRNAAARYWRFFSGEACI